MREGDGMVVSDALSDVSDADVDDGGELRVFVVVQRAPGYGHVACRLDVTSGGGVDEQGVGDGECLAVHACAIFRVEWYAAGFTDQDYREGFAGGDPDRCAVRPDRPLLVESAVLVEIGHACVHLTGGTVGDLLDSDDAVVGAAPVRDDHGVGRGRHQSVALDPDAGVDGIEHEPRVCGTGLVKLLPRCVVGLTRLDCRDDRTQHTKDGGHGCESRHISLPGFIGSVLMSRHTNIVCKAYVKRERRATCVIG